MNRTSAIVAAYGARQRAERRLGFSPERLERVAELMQRQIDAKIFPGAVTLIARDDQIAYFHAQGLMTWRRGGRCD